VHQDTTVAAFAGLQTALRAVVEAETRHSKTDSHPDLRTAPRGDFRSDRTHFVVDVASFKRTGASLVGVDSSTWKELTASAGSRSISGSMDEIKRCAPTNSALCTLDQDARLVAARTLVFDGKAMKLGVVVYRRHRNAMGMRSYEITLVKSAGRYEVASIAVNGYS